MVPYNELQQLIVSREKKWAIGSHMEITFVVTKDCQLECKYCYLVGKNKEERMSWNVAKAAVDYILSSEYDNFFATESVVFNFIGGEPFLEVELIEHICDYLKEQMLLLEHHWKDGYSFSITTNGINYGSPKVQHFINKHRGHVYIAITIDGTQQKHDLNRVWKASSNENFRGSYLDVVKNIPLWLEQTQDASTKVTVSSPDIPFVSESVLHLFALGIRTVYINCVFEDIWREGDDILLEQQLCILADEMLSSGLYKTHKCSFFDRRIGHPLEHSDDSNWCGAGRMLAIDGEGNYYPCHRFAGYSLRSKQERVVGNVRTGIRKNLVRPFLELKRSLQSPGKCLECEVASGCAWCQGENYDCSASGTIFYRSTAICKMHKARVRANNYYWSRIDELEGKRADNQTKPVSSKCILDKTEVVPDTVIVLLSTQSTPFCITGNDLSRLEKNERQEELLLVEALASVVRKVKAGEWNVQFVYPNRRLPEEYVALINSVPHRDIVPEEAHMEGDAVVIKNWDNEAWNYLNGKFHILITSLNDFYLNVGLLDRLLSNTDRLNVVFSDEAAFSEDDSNQYRNALKKLTMMVLRQWKSGRQIQVNLITDRLQLTEMSNCDAGWKSVTLAPNGRFYICPAFYYVAEGDDCGSLDTGIIIKDSLLYQLSHAPLCRNCNAYHCSRCVFLNKLKTKEVNIPSYEQCNKAELELEASRKFYELWKS